MCSACFSHVSFTGSNVSTSVCAMPVQLPYALQVLRFFLSHSKCYLVQNRPANLVSSTAVVQHDLWRMHCNRSCTNFQAAVLGCDTEVNNELTCWCLDHTLIVCFSHSAYHHCCSLSCASRIICRAGPPISVHACCNSLCFRQARADITSHCGIRIVL